MVNPEINVLSISCWTFGSLGTAILGTASSKTCQGKMHVKGRTKVIKEECARCTATLRKAMLKNRLQRKREVMSLSESALKKVEDTSGLVGGSNLTFFRHALAALSLLTRCF